MDGAGAAMCKQVHGQVLLSPVVGSSTRVLHNGATQLVDAVNPSPINIVLCFPMVQWR